MILANSLSNKELQKSIGKNKDLGTLLAVKILKKEGCTNLNLAKIREIVSRNNYRAKNSSCLILGFLAFLFIKGCN